MACPWASCVVATANLAAVIVVTILGGITVVIHQALEATHPLVARLVRLREAAAMSRLWLIPELGKQYFFFSSNIQRFDSLSSYSYIRKFDGFLCDGPMIDIPTIAKRKIRSDSPCTVYCPTVAPTRSSAGWLELRDTMSYRTQSSCGRHSLAPC
jgi:hypothetical protein